MKKFLKWSGRALERYALPIAERRAMEEVTKLADKNGFAAVLMAATMRGIALKQEGKEKNQ